MLLPKKWDKKRKKKEKLKHHTTRTLMSPKTCDRLCDQLSKNPISYLDHSCIKRVGLSLGPLEFN